MYNKEKDFYYNLSYAQIKNLYWNNELIVGYVANDEINNNNGNKDKTSIIELSRDEWREWVLPILLILNLVIMAVILGYTGMLQRMPILKYLVRTGINVLIDST